MSKCGKANVVNYSNNEYEKKQNYKQNFKKKTTTKEEVEIIVPSNRITYKIESHVK